MQGFARCKKEGEIYFIQDWNTKLIKIGIGSPAFPRLKALQGGSPSRFSVLAIKEGTYEEEFILHLKFESQKINGEWYRPIPELLTVIKEIEENNLSRTDNLRAKLEENRIRNLAMGALIESDEIKVNENYEITQVCGMDTLLTVSHLSMILSISEKKLLSWMRNGKSLPDHVEFHGCIRFRKADVQLWLDSITHEWRRNNGKQSSEEDSSKT